MIVVSHITPNTEQSAGAKGTAEPHIAPKTKVAPRQFQCWMNVTKSCSQIFGDDFHGERGAEVYMPCRGSEFSGPVG